MVSTEDEEDERLSKMVIDFIESDPSSQQLLIDHHLHLKSTSLSLQRILDAVTDPEVEILGKISTYMNLTDDTTTSKSNYNLKRWLALRLKLDGYEASLCRTPWDTSPGVYDYVEVMTMDNRNSRDNSSGNSNINDGNIMRVIVDVEFRSQFELARPTQNYREILECVPSVFVGTEEKLKEVVSVLCSAAKQSLTERGLHIPPWRRTSYMHSKWLSQNRKKFTFSSIADLCL